MSNKLFLTSIQALILMQTLLEYGREVRCFWCKYSCCHPQNSVKAVLLAFILEGGIGLNLSFWAEVTVALGGAEGNQRSVLGRMYEE